MRDKANRVEAILIAVALLAIAAASAFTWWNITIERETTRSASVRLADALAASIEQHVSAAFRDAENAAYSAAVLVENAGGFAGIGNRERLHRELKRELNDEESTTRLIAVDAEGRVLASSAEYPLGEISLSGQSAFAWHAAHRTERGFHLDAPYRSAIRRELVIPYSRAIFGADQRFIGVLIAELRVEHFVRLYGRMLNRDLTVISVLTRDGVILMRAPFQENLIGRKIPNTAPLAAALQGRSGVEYMAQRDGVMRIYSFRSLKRLPVVVVVGLDKEEVLAPWLEHTRERIAVVAIGAIAFLAFMAVLIIYLRRLARGEEQLRATAARLRALGDNLPGVFHQSVREPDGSTRIIYVSAGVTRMYGCTVQTVIEDPTLMRRSIIEADRERLNAVEQAALATMTSVDIELRCSDVNGEVRWRRLCASPRTLPDGRVLWDCMQFDVTERKTAEDALRRLNDKLEDRVSERTAELSRVNKDLEAFSYSVAHDLRAPLHRIAGFAGLLREDLGTLTSQAARKFDTIQRQVVHMGDLIESLLALARTSRATLYKAPLDLNAIVSELRATLAFDARDRDIHWTVDPLPEVQGDAKLIHFALANLLGNAVKFTRVRNPAKIHVGIDAAQAPAGEVLIFVQDNGAGFDMQYADKLFSPFQRMHSQSEFEGIGVGLANVQQIIERHGGRIWARAQPDAGATFFFTLPT